MPEGTPVSTKDSTPIVAADGTPPRKLHNLAYGIERIGLIPLRAPVLSAIILTLLCIAAAFGVHRLKVDDSLSQLFRSETKEFRQYEEVTKRFPSTEFDVLVVIEGKNLMARDSIDKLRDLVTDLQLIDSVRGLISLFSARQPPEGGQASRAGVSGGAADRRRHTTRWCSACSATKSSAASSCPRTARSR